MLKSILVATTLLVLPAAALGQDATAVDFFEKKIRPVLVDHCYGCHSQRAAQANELKGGLLLDSRDSIRRGGDSGPAVVPGKPAESLLLSALRHEDFEMPPKGRLSDRVVSDFARWIADGAADPRDGTLASSPQPMDVERGREHWAYRLPQWPDEPRVRDRTWAHGKIDLFLQQKLEQHGWLPAPDAQPAVLLRRLHYDLTGLPPSPEELDQFLRDPSHQAYRHVVDRLLASVRFGERWGRHWLDVARFGESNTLRGTVFSQAWRYRDWAIDAFNDDLPFNRFVLEQVAGDLLAGDSWQRRRRQLTATSLLSLGNTNFENQDKEQLRMDVVDEQLETIGRAFLAQTVACARCHDHKFDPIPTRDYYALAGILRNTKTLTHANVSRWLEVPLPGDPVSEDGFAQHDAAVKELQARIAMLQKSLGIDGQKLTFSKSVDRTLLPGLVVDDVDAEQEGAWTRSTSTAQFVNENYLHDMNSGQGQKWVTFEAQLPASGEYEVRMSYSAGGNRATNTPVTVQSIAKRKTVRINQRELPPINGLFISLGRFHFAADERVRVVVSNNGTDGHVIVDAIQFLSGQQAARLAPGASAKQVGTSEKPARAAAERAELRKRTAELKKLQAAAPAREMVMSVLEETEIGDTHVHIRGSVHNLGAGVARGFLRVAHYSDLAEFTRRESGRRQLGEWLASDLNPLTARVAVNRLWRWLFGVGLVRTTDNFGTVGEQPSHPELLDYLALQFQRDGWSVKSALRRMVMSHAYQTSSRPDHPATHGDTSAERTIDVENRLFWRMNRRRLEAECIRDTMLAVSGELQLEMHGPTFPSERKEDYDFRYEGLRRSVYIPVFRNALPDVFEAFDFANPSVVVGGRSASIVAPQALYLMNNPFVIARSRWAAQRLCEEFADASDAQRIERAYRLTLGRSANEAERRLALEFVKANDGTAELDVWSELFQALFGTLDFRYLD